MAFHLYACERGLSSDLNVKKIVDKYYIGMAFVQCEYECGELVHQTGWIGDHMHQWDKHMVSHGQVFSMVD